MGGSEGLKGASKDKTEELYGIGRGGGSGRLSGSRFGNNLFIFLNPTRIKVHHIHSSDESMDRASLHACIFY